jgi:hypothetical protein
MINDQTGKWLEECIRCLRWIPIEEMVSDEEGHEYLCKDCCPIIHYR